MHNGIYTHFAHRCYRRNTLLDCLGSCSAHRRVQSKGNIVTPHIGEELHSLTDNTYAGIDLCM